MSGTFGPEELQVQECQWRGWYGTDGQSVSLLTRAGFAANSVCAQSLSCIRPCDPWTAVCQAPLSMGFPRQEYWRGLPFSSPAYLPHQVIKPTSPSWQVDSFQWTTWEALLLTEKQVIYKWRSNDSFQVSGQTSRHNSAEKTNILSSKISEAHRLTFGKRERPVQIAQRCIFSFKISKIPKFWKALCCRLTVVSPQYSYADT